MHTTRWLSITAFIVVLCGCGETKQEAADREYQEQRDVAADRTTQKASEAGAEKTRAWLAQMEEDSRQHMLDVSRKQAEEEIARQKEELEAKTDEGKAIELYLKDPTFRMEPPYWMDTRSRTRHKQGCVHFKAQPMGRYCKSDEGKACAQCGG